jgi:two-component system, chemotaxis family, CheB/CheR fusion protein
MPYKTSQNVIDGATITFINISELKNFQEKIKSALNYAENIINTVREPLIVLDHELKVISANKSFYETFKLKRSDVEDEKIYSIANNEWNISALRNLLEGILQKNRVMTNFEFEHNFTGVGHKKMILNARIIYRGDIDTDMILLAMEDKRE